MPRRIKSNKRNAEGLLDGFDSDLERSVSYANGSIPHNKVKLPYILKPKTYCPDFLLPVGDSKFLLVETKGVLTGDERAKYCSIRDCYPQIAETLKVSHVELVFVFQKSTNKINPRNPNSKTYGEWATSEGFRWTDRPYFDPEWFEDDLYTTPEIA